MKKLAILLLFSFIFIANPNNSVNAQGDPDDIDTLSYPWDYSTSFLLGKYMAIKRTLLPQKFLKPAPNGGVAVLPVGVQTLVPGSERFRLRHKIISEQISKLEDEMKNIHYLNRKFNIIHSAASVHNSVRYGAKISAKGLDLITSMGQNPMAQALTMAAVFSIDSYDDFHNYGYITQRTYLSAYGSIIASSLSNHPAARCVDLSLTADSIRRDLINWKKDADVFRGYSNDLRSAQETVETNYAKLKSMLNSDYSLPTLQIDQYYVSEFGQKATPLETRLEFFNPLDGDKTWHNVATIDKFKFNTVSHPQSQEAFFYRQTYDIDRMFQTTPDIINSLQLNIQLSTNTVNSYIDSALDREMRISRTLDAFELGYKPIGDTGWVHHYNPVTSMDHMRGGMHGIGGL